MRNGTATLVRRLLPGAAVIAAAAALLFARGRQPFVLKNRVALITGGSRGLGLAIARHLGRLGAHVALAARDRAELDAARSDLQSRGIGVTAIVCDLSSRGAGQRLVEEVVGEHGRLDVLVNNAGIIEVGPFDHMQQRDFEMAMDVHFWAPLETMRAAIPVMRRQGGGHIANVSSIGGRIGVPHLVPYCASKFALTGLSTALRAELRQDNIFVTTVSPGLMRTGSPFNAWFKGRHREEFLWFTVSDSVPILTVDAARAASKVVAGLRRGIPEVIIGWPAKLAILAHAVAPNTLAYGMDIANGWVLPAATGDDGDRARSGWQSFSAWAPSVITRLTESAAVENNEVPRG